MKESSQSDKKKVSFKILGEPKGKQRPRTVHKGSGVRTYTPKQTVMYENLVVVSYYEQVGTEMLEAPIKARIVGVFPIPKSTSKKNREKMLSGEVVHTKKPDGDNLAKIVLDSLNNVAFHDDSGVASMTIEKIYGETPMVLVELEEM